MKALAIVILACLSFGVSAQTQEELQAQLLAKAAEMREHFDAKAAEMCADIIELREYRARDGLQNRIGRRCQYAKQYSFADSGFQLVASRLQRRVCAARKLLIVCYAAKRSMLNGSMGNCVVPVVIRSARISPTTGPSRKPWRKIRKHVIRFYGAGRIRSPVSDRVSSLPRLPMRE